MRFQLAFVNAINQINKLIGVFTIGYLSDFGDQPLGWEQPALPHAASLGSALRPEGSLSSQQIRHVPAPPLAAAANRCLRTRGLVRNAPGNLAQPGTFQSCRAAKSSLEKAHFVLPGMAPVTPL